MIDRQRGRRAAQFRVHASARGHGDRAGAAVRGDVHGAVLCLTGVDVRPVDRHGHLIVLASARAAGRREAHPVVGSGLADTPGQRTGAGVPDVEVVGGRGVIDRQRGRRAAQLRNRRTTNRMSIRPSRGSVLAPSSNPYLEGAARARECVGS